MKYFFLTEGWSVGRVWESGGLWDERSWRRKPHIRQISVYIWENGEKLWLYRVEDAILMVEVFPQNKADVDSATKSIGQVVLKRLMDADQVIERLALATDGTAAS